jgi:rRNA maturation endonuclease Nob1
MGQGLLMHCICKNMCQREEFKTEYKTTRVHKDAFRLGYSRCRKCEYYIKEFTYCPCCGTRLAIGPRNAKSKRILKSEIGRY